jgi:signal transduction histidine kinase
MDVNSLVRDVGAILSSQQEFQGTALRTELEDSLPAVRGDLHLAQQMLVNVMLNASQAMTDGGVVTVRTFLDKTSGRVGISVSDEGPGISEADLPHIFEPFFTLKQQGRGSGLGLALCKRIAASMNAVIEVDSRPGEGATFKVLFLSGRENGRSPKEDG